MLRVPTAEEIRLQLVDLLRRAKGLHGDLVDRSVRAQVRAIALEMQAAVNAIDADTDNESCLAALAVVDRSSERLGRMVGGAATAG